LKDSSASLSQLSQANTTVLDQHPAFVDIRNRISFAIQGKGALATQLEELLDESDELLGRLDSQQIQHIALQQSQHDTAFLAQHASNTIHNLMLGYSAIFEQFTYMTAKAYEQITLTPCDG